jgi:hypothetical protein
MDSNYREAGAFLLYRQALSSAQPPLPIGI